MAKKPVILIVTCYSHPDYVRAVTLREACKRQGTYTTIELKNNRTGLLRYPEVMLRYLWLRFRYRPTTIILTFRGYELLPLLGITKGKSQLIYDEFINPLHWATYEHGKIQPESFSYRVMRSIYRWCINRCDYVLLDTSKHVLLSQRITGHTRAVYAAIPVGADESLFRASNSPKNKTGNKFMVLYYGTMLPLHGLDVVLEAAVLLRDQDRIVFDLIGGKDEHTKDIVSKARARGAHVNHTEWVETQKLPDRIAAADVCLGGPFGKTEQASVVVTGKTYQFLSMAMPTIVGSESTDKILVHKKTVLSVPLGDAQALADMILWSYQNTSEMKKIAKEGHEAFVKNYSTVALGRLLNGILEGKPSA